MPSLAIVIPAYNAEKHLAQTLKSVLRSTYSDLEVLVINDGSKDRTAEVAAGLGDARVRVITRPNSGASASRNFGIDAADSEYIALLDSDDIWHPEKAHLQIKVLRENPDFGYTFTEFLSWDGGDTAEFDASAVSDALDPKFTGWIHHHMLLTNWSLPSSTIFRRSAWNQSGGFLCDDHQTDDWEYFARVSRDFQFAKLRDPMVLYRRHPQSLSRRLSPLNKGELLREKMLREFGNVSPQGIPVDASLLRQRRYEGWKHFASEHLAQGDLKIGLSGMWNLLVDGPRRLETVEVGVKSLAKRLLHKT